MLGRNLQIIVKKCLIKTDCEDVIGECPNLQPRDCYYEYYARACCKTCRALVQNPSDANCLYGDRGTACLDLAPEICYLSTRFCCQTCAAYLSSTNTTDSSSSSSETANDFSASALPVTNSTNTSASTSFVDSCIHGDFEGVLEYISMWGNRLLLNCKQLVKHDSNLCYNDDVQKYCCASCSRIKMIEGQYKYLLNYRILELLYSLLINIFNNLAKINITKFTLIQIHAKVKLKRWPTCQRVSLAVNWWITILACVKIQAQKRNAAFLAEASTSNHWSGNLPRQIRFFII